jgi:hypothetical protein
MTKSRRMRWAEHVACREEKSNEHRIFEGKPKGKRQLGRRRPRWEDNIKVYLRETGYGWYGLDYSGSG